MVEILELLPLIIPLLLVQIALAVYALRVLYNTEKVRGESKLLWIFVIIFVNLLGPIVFLMYGRVTDVTGSKDE